MKDLIRAYPLLLQLTETIGMFALLLAVAWLATHTNALWNVRAN